MNLVAGLGGAERNACVALCTADRVLGICEQERITRVRGAGVNASGMPDEALDELLRRIGHTRTDVRAIAVAEDTAPIGVSAVLRVDHHFAHACAAFLPSPFESAAIVICDHEAPQVSVWRGQGRSVTRIDRRWEDLGFVELYSQCANVLGFAGGGHEQRMEALARLAPDSYDGRVEGLFDRAPNGLRLASGWKSTLEDWVRDADLAQRSAIAASIQSRIADLLLDLISDVAGANDGGLCLGGSLFYNSYINSRIKRHIPEQRVYVPVNPGNAGVSVGAACHALNNARLEVTAFSGPCYTEEEIKATIDNCKLTYQWAGPSETIAIAVEALLKGRLVAWFDGPMECGVRALGGRSILASPFSPYVLDNLNRFLKHREVWRGYALSGIEGAVGEHFVGPEASPFMDCDYQARNPECFRFILPQPGAAVRVQTVATHAPSRFRALLQAFGRATGIPILVNTSFNGFREPIVCSPRDAVRVFYGTGADILILGEFVLVK